MTQPLPRHLMEETFGGEGAAVFRNRSSRFAARGPYHRLRTTTQLDFDKQHDQRQLLTVTIG